MIWTMSARLKIYGDAITVEIPRINDVQSLLAFANQLRDPFEVG